MFLFFSKDVVHCSLFTEINFCLLSLTASFCSSGTIFGYQVLVGKKRFLQYHMTYLAGYPVNLVIFCSASCSQRGVVGRRGQRAAPQLTILSSSTTLDWFRLVFPLRSSLSQVAFLAPHILVESSHCKGPFQVVSEILK